MRPGINPVEALRAFALTRTRTPSADARTRLRAEAWARAGCQAPADRGTWFRIENAASERATVWIDDFIGMWGVDAKTFREQLDAITAPDIDLMVNSPGGDVWDGYAIHHALASHPAKVTAHVVGLAASAASFIIMAGDKIIAYRPSQIMIHDALSFIDVFGRFNPADIANLVGELEQVATLLDQISDTIAGVYAHRAGGSAADWRAAMRAETWYTPDTALAAGLVDRVGEKVPALDPPAEPAPTPNEETAENARSQAVRARARVSLERK